jgi:rubrerythrin
MDLSKYSLEDLIISAIKSEVDAKAIYLKIAGGIKNALLKDRLTFIAEEEERHRQFLSGMFSKEFPGKEIVLPEKTPVPLPELSIDDENISLVEIFERVMEAEKAAYSFYNSFSEKFDKDSNENKMLLYFASMEMGHFKLFELEKENMERFEEFDTDWPMMHVGP